MTLADFMVKPDTRSLAELYRAGLPYYRAEQAGRRAAVSPVGLGGVSGGQSSPK